MNDQLDLLPPTSAADRVAAPPATGASWELDEHTRSVGRLGLAAARLALREASARLAA